MMSTINWVPMSAGQADGLMAVIDESFCPIVIGREPDTKVLIVLPSSKHDLRRWDIDRDGTVTRFDREADKACRKNRFPQRILKTVTK